MRRIKVTKITNNVELFRSRSQYSMYMYMYKSRKLMSVMCTNYMKEGVHIALSSHMIFPSSQYQGRSQRGSHGAAPPPSKSVVPPSRNDVFKSSSSLCLSIQNMLFDYVKY